MTGDWKVIHRALASLYALGGDTKAQAGDALESLARLRRLSEDAPHELVGRTEYVVKIERELAEARALAEKFLGERVPRSDVERARREGAEAMREAAAQACRPMLRDMASRSTLAREIRALPLPGDAP